MIQLFLRILYKLNSDCNIPTYQPALSGLFEHFSHPKYGQEILII